MFTKAGLRINKEFHKNTKKGIPNYDKHFMIKAGLTALSHIYGRYSTDIVDRTHYDLLYVQNYNLLVDIRIILHTSRTLFLKDTAEGVNTVDHQEAAKNKIIPGYYRLTGNILGDSG